MNKTTGIIVILLLMTTMFASFVVAESEIVTDIKDVGTEVLDLFFPILKFITGQDDATKDNAGTEFIARVLFAIILFSVVWVALDRIPIVATTRWAHWLSSLAVGLLGVRYLGNTEMINNMILPYSVMGIAIICIIPFIVFFFVVNDFSRSGRKMAWIFFAIVFFGLWIARASEGAPESLAVGKFAWIYFVTALASLAMLYFDRTIQNAMRRSQAEDLNEVRTAQIRTDVLERRYQLEERRLRGTIAPGDYTRLSNEIAALERRYGLPTPTP